MPLSAAPTWSRRWDSTLSSRCVWTHGSPASETLLAHMVGNLIDNAIIHNQPGGWVRVITTVHDECVQLIVENSGPLLDPEEVKHLTQPFRRIGAERTGSDDGFGLGLAIVASIVRPGSELAVSPSLQLANSRCHGAEQRGPVLLLVRI